MAALLRWRIRARRGASIDMTIAPALARISAVQAGIVVLMVGAATAVARGFLH
jgi:putative membrane protein